ncbi:MotA/TolQ/ExbB proton channel family protein [Plasticicumulans lactativorans]|uniref:MotA/TolQ/ExbB proton channel family protein n=2 Tax=Plasticicumulans lactativorans TaxID=1133106 RepID=A0A4V2SD80_9GAMM|nr:MotA/TolQ/ExbB proton channel family protein [Plasticicumulans lactativorans]
MQAVFAHWGKLGHAWTEYSETLHPQYDVMEGERRLVKLRATVPAGAFFSPSVLVDTPLRTEFFKHLPGILTGIGIIGTFFGLLAGLQNFQVGTDSTQLQTSLAELMHGVREAFIASAGAIGAAMVVTFLEKLLLNRCYARAEALAQTIDSSYEAGAGEEYLSRLVNSAEESAAQTRLLKDALVNDLKELLGSFSHTISTSIAEGLRAHGDRLIHPETGLSGSISGAIAEGLREPMAQITRVAETVGGHQGDAINDLMSALIGKIESTFGGQMSGLNDLMASNASAMQSMQTRFGELVERLASAGTDTTAAVENHLRTLMDDVDRRQRETNAAMIELLGQVKASVAESQRDSAAKLAESVAAIGASVDALLRDLATQREAMGEAGRQSLDELKTGLGALVEQLRASSHEAGELYRQELQRLFAEAERRQQQLGEQVLTLVQHMQVDQAERQTRTGEALQDNLAAVQAGLGKALGAIQQQLAEAETRARSSDQERAAAELERRWQLEQQTAELLRALAARTEQLGAAVDQSVGALRATVDRLAQITVTGSESLERGAGSVRAAAEDMGSAGQHIAQVLDRGAELHGHVAGAASDLTTATNGLREIVAGYTRQREQIDILVGTLRQLVADAEARTGVSRNLVADMQRMVEQARTLQDDSRRFVEGIGGVLETGFNRFSDAVTDNLNAVTDDLHHVFGEITSGLSTAVSMISSQIQDLEAALDQLVRAAASRR